MCPDLGAPIVPVALAHFEQFIANDAHQPLRGFENLQQIHDGVEQRLVFLAQLFLFQSGQAVQAQVEDCLGLTFRQPVALLGQPQLPGHAVRRRQIRTVTRQHLRHRPGRPGPRRISCSRASAGLRLALISTITSSMFPSATASPSSSWARARALRSSNSVRRVTTSRRCRMNSPSISLRPKSRGCLSVSATILMPNTVCSCVC